MVLDLPFFSPSLSPSHQPPYDSFRRYPFVTAYVQQAGSIFCASNFFLHSRSLPFHFFTPSWFLLSPEAVNKILAIAVRILSRACCVLLSLFSPSDPKPPLNPPSPFHFFDSFGSLVVHYVYKLYFCEEGKNELGNIFLSSKSSFSTLFVCTHCKAQGVPETFVYVWGVLWKLFIRKIRTH